MNRLDTHVDDYLRLRRSLGFKLDYEGKWLAQFADYVHAAGAATVTTELAIAWAQQPAGIGPNGWAKRLGVVRKFAAWLQTIDPAAEIPPSGVFPARRHRPTPCLWSHQDIVDLMKGARALRPALRAETHETIFGLLASSGMRVGEAVALVRDDVDLETGVITIHEAKFDRSRLVPLHPTVNEALGRYATQRDRLCPRPRSTAFFLSSTGAGLGRGSVGKTLRKITTAMGLRTDTVHPRVHDLRHRWCALFGEYVFGASSGWSGST